MAATPAIADLVLVPSEAQFQKFFSAYSVKPETGRDIKELEQAFAAFQQQKFDECLTQLTNAHERNPSLPPARMMLAVFLVESHQVAQARLLLESIAIEQADYPPLYEAFGRVALKEGRLTDASVLIDRAVRLAAQTDWDKARRERFHRQCDLGLAAVAEGRQDWQKAREHLKNAGRRTTNDVALHLRLARAMVHLGESESAYAELSKVADRDPSIEAPQITMARLHSECNEHQQAEEWLKHASDQHPNRIDVMVTYASWLLDRGRMDEAAAAVQKAVKVAPESPHIKSLLGTLARFRREHQTAESHFQNLLNDHPGSFDFSNQLALSLIEQTSEEKQQKAVQLAEVNARQYPRAEPALATLGWVYYRVGRLADAQRVLQAAISGGRATSETAYYLARVMAETDRLDEVRTLLERALASDGRFLHRDDAQAWLEQVSMKLRKVQAEEINN